MGLTEYKRKRNFGVTSEPAGGKSKPKAVRGACKFVIQKHDASRLHYDFRLEMDGVLKSWAVPKGLPWKQGEKHLAVEVEDHPVEYATFEGIIPEGQYGGGTVMVWDRGNYFVYGEKPIESLRQGKLHLVLEGKKAEGEWTLIRIRGNEAKPPWLLLKSGASLPVISKKSDNLSVKTGRTMEQIAGARDAEWQSNRPGTDSPASSLRTRIKAAVAKKKNGSKAKKKQSAKKTQKFTGADLKNSPSAKARFIEPMKPKLVDTAPKAGDWIYELKFDGIRLIAIKAEKTRLLSRNQNDLSGRFPEIVEALEKLPAGECVVDGEVVALDNKGRSSFQLLQAGEMLATGRVRPTGGEGRKAPVYFYVFDLLQLDGKQIMGLPLERRKELLGGIVADAGDPIRYSDQVGEDAPALLAEVKRRGLEGIIGKQRGSVYESGRRSGAWIKLKCVHEQEFVIGGFTPPGGSRKYFGALLVGYYQEKRLLFAGKVGTGFNTRSLAELHKRFEKESRSTCPFADLPSKLATGRVRPAGGQGGQWVQGITPSMMKRCYWINPVFVCQVKFAEWTRDKKLRQPVFIGLREDKRAREVGLET